MITTPVRSMPVRVSQQRGERGDLVGLAVHAELAEHDPGVLVDHREQVPAGDLGAVAVGVSGAAQGLAVDGEHPAPPGRGDRRRTGAARTRRSRRRTGRRRLSRAAGGSPIPTGSRRSVPSAAATLGGQVGDPLGDRDERARPGRDRAHRRGQHHRPGHGGRRGACGDRPPSASAARRSGASATGSGSSTPPTGRREQRWTRMQMRARLSSDDRAWCENRKITTRVVPAPSPHTACRRSSAPTHRDFADPLPSTTAAQAANTNEHRRTSVRCTIRPSLWTAWPQPTDRQARA